MPKHSDKAVHTNQGSYDGCDAKCRSYKPSEETPFFQWCGFGNDEEASAEDPTCSDACDRVSFMFVLGNEMIINRMAGMGVSYLQLRGR